MKKNEIRTLWSVFAAMLICFGTFTFVSCGGDDDEEADAPVVDNTPNIDLPQLGFEGNRYAWDEKLSSGESVRMWYEFAFESWRNFTPCKNTMVYALCHTMKAAEEFKARLEAKKVDYSQNDRYFSYQTDEFNGRSKIELVKEFTGEDLTPDPQKIDTTQLMGIWDNVYSKTTIKDKTLNYEYSNSSEYDKYSTRWVFVDNSKLIHQNIMRDEVTHELYLITSEKEYFYKLYIYDENSEHMRGILLIYENSQSKEGKRLTITDLNEKSMYVSR